MNPALAAGLMLAHRYGLDRVPQPGTYRRPYDNKPISKREQKLQEKNAKKRRAAK